MKKLYLLFFVAFISLTSMTWSQTTLSQWSFETQVISLTSAVSPTITPATDDAALAGTVVSGLHATATTTWGPLQGNGSPNSLYANNWSMGDYFQFQFPTIGYGGISITWDQTGSRQGPRDFKVQYSTNGTSFTDATGTNSTIILGSSTLFSATNYDPTFTRTLDLSGVSSLNNQSNVYIRIVDNSTTSILGGTVTTAGTDLIDNFIAKYNGLLPVELSSFTSNVNGRNVNLIWQTKTEKNSDKFVIEREAIGANWEAIGSVKAAVLSNSPKNYIYTDTKLQSGKYQYRLKMVDNDGSFAYSSVEATEIAIPKGFVVSQNYPNPFNPSTKIDYQVPVDSKVIMEVYNITGQKVVALVNQEQSAGYYTVDFGASKLSSGVYIYRIVASDKSTGNNFSSIKKMMLLK